MLENKLKSVLVAGATGYLGKFVVKVFRSRAIMFVY
jgi:thioester reductase-like protein